MSETMLTGLYEASQAGARVVATIKPLIESVREMEREHAECPTHIKVLTESVARESERRQQAEQRAAALRSAGQWTLPWLVDGLDNCQECGESSVSCTCELGQFRALLAASGGAAPAERAESDALILPTLPTTYGFGTIVSTSKRPDLVIEDDQQPPVGQEGRG